ncbi:MAG: ABC transporter permease [Candidatus Caldarchaeales archaeon]
MFKFIISFLIFLKNRLPSSFKERIGYFLILPALASVGVMFTGLLYLFYVSFNKYDIFKLFIPEFTLENYIKVFVSQGSSMVFARTFYLSILVSISCIALGIPYAYYMVRTSSSFIQKMLIFFTLVPFFTGDVIKAYGWLIVLGKNGLIAWLTKTLFNYPLEIINTALAVFIGLIQIILPLSILIIAPSVAAVNRELEMAAQNLGATPIQTFFKIVLPLLKPGIIGAFIVSFTISVTEYAAPDLLGGGINDFVANFVYMIMFNAVNYPYSAAISILLMLIASIIVYTILKIGRVGNIFIRGGR